MISFKGFKELLKQYENLPDVGWLYICHSFNLSSQNDITNGSYFLAENEDEEIYLEENLGTFLEVPIFKAIIENTMKCSPKLENNDFLEAVRYYLENDDFQY
ncbi:hypothetical protein [Enterobacter sp. DE0047]|uniref:DUF7716 domain-containing protein n=1 Tax=Enterobacter sp. DE0047 TaxID=2584949 RepID=UPI0011A0910F|nr:hypothetical protein [Enterobacter sp. DE0047]